MNMWVAKGKTITPEKLLGSNFLSRDKKLTKEDWENQKKQIKRMAKKHAVILKKIKAGEMKSKTATKTKGR